MSDPIRVVVGDDHPLFREGVARTLQEAEGIEVAALARDADEAVAATLRLRPDLALLDIHMPGGGLQAAQRILREGAPTRVAMLTVSEADEDVMAALRMGAIAYVLKGVSGSELVSIVRDAAEGRLYVPPALAARLLSEMRAEERRKAEDPLAALTQREEEVLRLIAQGLSNKEVARALDLQEKTVKHHMTAILQKLHARNRVEAALIAKERLRR